MDHRPKYNTKILRGLEDTIEKDLGDVGFAEACLD